MIKIVENGEENGIRWCKIKVYSEDSETFYKGSMEAKEKAIELLGDVTECWLSGDDVYTCVNTMNIINPER